jgi:hypothetical protein
MLVLSACSKPAPIPTSLPDYVPPSYYNGNITTPENLLQSYFGPGADPAAYTRYDGRVYVFENLVIIRSKVENATEHFMWMGNIQCYFFKGGAAEQLKANEKVDMVGFDLGLSSAAPGCLLFSGCVFVPAGSVQLKPAPTTLPPFALATNAFQVYSDFQDNLQKSNNKYIGVTLNFRNVTVEQMTTIGEADAGNEYYLQTGMIKFHAAVSDVIFDVREGDIVDVVGTITGMQNSYLNVDILDVTVIDPPGGFSGDVGY